MRRVVAEITWLIQLREDLSISLSLPISLHSYSQAAIHIARNPIFHERTKHVALDCHFVRQQFLYGIISLTFIPSSSQLADLFIKHLSGPSNSSILSKLGVVSLPSILREGVGNHSSSHNSIMSNSVTTKLLNQNEDLKNQEDTKKEEKKQMPLRV